MLSIEYIYSINMYTVILIGIYVCIVVIYYYNQYFINIHICTHIHIYTYTLIHTYTHMNILPISNIAVLINYFNQYI